MSSPARSFDARVPAIWAVLLTVSVFAHVHVEIANDAARGVRMPYGAALAIQVSSHLVVAARGRVALVDPRTQSPGSLTLVGMHGSLTHEELAIPALVDVV